MAQTGKRLEVRFMGIGSPDTRVKLGDRVLTEDLRSVDIHLRAGELPEVILRPVIPEAALLLDGSDGLWPKVSLAVDVEYTLHQLGWLGPGDLEEIRQQNDELTVDLNEARAHAAALERELAAVRGHSEDQVGASDPEPAEAGSDTLLDI